MTGDTLVLTAFCLYKQVSGGAQVCCGGAARSELAACHEPQTCWIVACKLLKQTVRSGSATSLQLTLSLGLHEASCLLSDWCRSLLSSCTQGSQAGPHPCTSTMCALRSLRLSLSPSVEPGCCHAFSLMATRLVPQQVCQQRAHVH